LSAMRLALAALLATLASPAWATVFTLTPSMNWQQTLSSLKAGDEAVFSPGTYVLTGRLALTLPGTATQPITLRGQPGAIVRRNDANQNLIDFERATFVTLSGLEFAGGSRGLRFMAGNDVTVRDCEVHDTDSSAITTNDSGQTYARFHFLHNQVHHTAGTGEGFYLGCNNDGCRLQDSEVVNNWVHHTNGPNVMVGFGTAIQLKEGGSGNVLADNVVHDTGAPCVLVDSAAGHGAANVVERNLLFNCGDHGVQASQDAIIRNNIILKVAIDGIAVQPHQAGLPQNVTIVNNTIVVPTGNAISVRSPSGSVVVGNNALYAVSGAAFFANGTTSTINFRDNVGVGAVSGLSASLLPGSLGGDFAQANANGTLPSNLKPAPSGALVGSGLLTLTPVLDFDLVMRTAADVGAYAAGGAPKWVLAEGFKVITGAPPIDAGVDAGVADAGGTDAGATDAGAMDAGSDAGGVDAGQLDAGAGPGGSSGCGCSEVDAGVLFAALALVGLLRRRA
jgi:uncharacterized protein (TIGR03382 family)